MMGYPGGIFNQNTFDSENAIPKMDADYQQGPEGILKTEHPNRESEAI
jgi:hypothetical protein